MGSRTQRKGDRHPLVNLNRHGYIRVLRNRSLLLAENQVGAIPLMLAGAKLQQSAGEADSSGDDS
jgi:hypothetical protein